ncbi:MAG TPA: YlbF family regulator [Candidatus Avimonoglobus intestinipullorum]|uniref:YlbF family regulator n=1 Tax=Candidatus Avimonoglobus intestinipullorum TaxID=2840699 RepID=A0A9D1LWE1_9FIRM|nr:YlbF family regulator [Candidatus Avimonoglobus intestinipullorum]
MTILEKAHELGAMIQESPEMAAMKQAEEAQAADETAQTLLQEFNLKRMNLARDMQAGKIEQKEAVKLNNDAFDAMVEKSAVIKNYIEAKKAFDARINEINGILNFYITGQEPGCTHDCSTCGGCH